MEYPAVCNFCDRSSTVQVQYDYCYQCGCYLCKECTEDYKKKDKKELWISVQREELLPEVKNIAELQNLCAQNKAMVVLFWLEHSSSSTMFRDAIIYHQGKLIVQPNKYIPKIAAAKYSNTSAFNEFVKRYGLKEYPTLILLDAKAQPVRTIIGFSWFQVGNLYMTQKRIIEGKGIKNIAVVFHFLFRIALFVPKACSLNR
jgi:hypothetical protein